MKTEKDIRKFFQDNKIPVPEDDAFMADLVRQIDLLPVPASLNGVDEEKIQENMRILALIREALRKRYRRQAVKTLIIDIVLCSILFVAVYFLLPRLSEGSSVVQFVLAWKNLIFSAMCLGVLAFSFSQTGMMKV